MILLIITIFGSLFLLLLIGVPIGLCLLDSTVICMKVARLPLSIALTRMVSGSQSFLLTAIPFFTLAGIIMREGGLSKKITNFSLILVGHLQGSLGHVNIISSMIFGGISGSSVADTASIGSIMIPEMIKNNYPPDISAAITAASSTIGIIIPPSIPMILYALISGVSIAKLFLAGVTPGILVGIGQMIINMLISKKRGFPIHQEQRSNLKEFIKGTKDGILAIGMPILIVGSITIGIVTATEAAVIAVNYALFIGLFVYRKLNLNKLPGIFLEAANVTAVVMFIVISANALGWLLGYLRIPQIISENLLTLSEKPIVILLIINLILLIVGTVSDLAPNILILTPVFLPVILQLGIDPLHFGIVLILNQAIALITPPVGNCLYICSNIGKVSVEEVFIAAIPFILINLIVLLLVVFVPEVALWLPNLLMK